MSSTWLAPEPFPAVAVRPCNPSPEVQLRFVAESYTLLSGCTLPLPVLETPHAQPHPAQPAVCVRPHPRAVARRRRATSAVRVNLDESQRPQGPQSRGLRPLESHYEQRG